MNKSGSFRPRLFTAVSLAALTASMFGQVAWAAKGEFAGRPHKYKNLPGIRTTAENRWNVVEELNVFVAGTFALGKQGMTAHIGAYAATEAMSGPGDRFGFLAEVQLPLRGDRLHLALEYISGNNALGSGTIQLYWQLAPHWRIDVGVQLPAPGSPNTSGALLGLGWH